MNLLPVFIVGLLGSVHCIGMCGGIVSALSAADGPRKPFPVPVRTVTASVIDSKKSLLTIPAASPVTRRPVPWPADWWKARAGSVC